DSVGREIDTRRQWSRIAVDDDLDREPGITHLGCERLELRESGLWQKRQLLVARPEHVDETAHLLHRLSTGPLDRPQGSLRLLGLGAKDATSSVCLEHDHAERVPDNIVELASDTCPLLLDSSSSVLLAVTLQHVRALLKQVFSCPSMPDRPSEHPRGAS